MNSRHSEAPRLGASAKMLYLLVGGNGYSAIRTQTHSARIAAQEMDFLSGDPIAARVNLADEELSTDEIADKARCLFNHC